MTVERAADIVLADGSTAHVRQIRPADADAIVALHSRFSERTRYLRYFSPYPRIPPRDLERFVRVDHRDREAFVVELGDELIAVARYERLGEGSPEAEVAFVVEDAHQGRGLGPVLLEYLAAAAAEEGISRFVAEVLPSNAAMLGTFAAAGYSVERRYADGVVHLSFPIAPTDASVRVQRAREHRAEAASIARLLAPRGVAVYGGGTPAGAALLRNLRGGGFPGPILESTVDSTVDLAVLAVEAERVPTVVAEAGDAHIHGLVVVASGFADTGPAGAQAQAELVRMARGDGMRLVGPNSLGVANTAVGLNATLAPRLPGPGRVGLFSQSAALGGALLAEAVRRGIGLSTFVSAGNRADVSGNDVLQYWLDDPGTDVVLLYLETFGNPRKFARVAREVARRKPIAAVAGAVRPPALAAVARGPGERGIAALFASSGVIRAATVAELFDVGLLLASQPLPAGHGLAVVTNAAALGALAQAAARGAGLSTVDGYPVEVPDAGLAGAVRGALAHPEVHTVLVAYAPPLPDQVPPADLGAAVIGADKPIATVGLGFASYPAVEEAVRALGRVAGYAAWRREPPGEEPELSDVDTERAHRAVESGDATGLLRAYGIATVPTRFVAGTPEAVAALAEEVGFPVALTVPPARRRLDVRAVRLDLADTADVTRAYTGLEQLLGPRVEVAVQPMVAPGVDCVVEVVDDPSFGPVVGFGLGGVAGDLIGDRAWRPAPLTDRDATALLREPRAAPLLSGYRGSAPVDLGALADLLIRVGRLADDHPQVRHLELNPVLARPDGLDVLQATVHIGQQAARPDTGPRRLSRPEPEGTEPQQA
jgi:acyl-CoA synthetase (NDP forming)/RimJ/RimL family protein N-acetyltransferase